MPPAMQYTEESKLSHKCYDLGQFRYGLDGKTILNESGLPAKVGQIILRAGNGFPLVRFGDKGPVEIDLKSGKPIKDAKQ